MKVQARPLTTTIETEPALMLFDISELNAARRQISRYYPGESGVLSRLSERINSPDSFEQPMFLSIEGDDGRLAMNALHKRVVQAPQNLGEYVEQAQAAAILGIELEMDGARAMQWAIAAADWRDQQNAKPPVAINNDIATMEYALVDL
ncbi:MAG TPA: hypothetical protein VLE74_03430 [Candidatus Saccharimonadales bacterium]|nr:hypothetical protein [Candidatus Saccharimonadales bacterium]